jgi:putative MATE family efflux protein
MNVPGSSRPDWQILWALAWPAVLLNSLQTVNSLLDGFFIGQLPPAALTAVGSATASVFFFGSLTFIMGVAATALVSRFYGAEDYVQMKMAADKCLALSLYLGVFLTLLAVPAAPYAAQFFAPKGNAEAARLMTMYLSLFALALPFLTYIQALAGALRGIGDTVSPMVLSGIQIGLHILLNWVLIFPSHQIGPVSLPGANLGLMGAGISMTASAAIAAGLYAIWAHRSPLQAKISLAWPGMDWAKRILNIAGPSGVLNMVRVTSLMAFTRILAETPQASSALAGMRLGFSIESLAFMPAFGLAVAASALVGQSLGMENPARATRIGWLAAHHAAAVSTVAAVILVVFADPLAGMIAGSQPEVAHVTAQFLRYIGVTEPFFAYMVVLLGAMQGAGDTKSPMWLSLIVMWMVRVPAAAVFALPFGLGMGSDGAWLAMSLTQLIGGLLAMVLFAQGRWKSVRI